MNIGSVEANSLFLFQPQQLFRRSASMDKIRPEISFADDRGEITDLIEGGSINAITYISFVEGAIRGNHYHKKTTQWNYVISGKIKLVSHIHGEPIVETIMGVGDMTITKPNESHALVAMSDSKLMVFTKGPRGGKDYENDTFRLVEPLVNK